MDAQWRDCYCDICKITFPCEWRLQRHLLSEKHRSNAACHTVLGQFHFKGDVREVDAYNEDQGQSSFEDGWQVEDNPELYPEIPSDEDFEIEITESGILDLLQCDEDLHASFYPFPNKIFALLYFLVHAPRPSGEANLSFIWFIMKQAGLSVPSLGALKQFKIPGVSAPSMCFSPTGIPFYYLSISSIIRNSLGTHNIATQLHRYPTVANTTYTEIFHGRKWNMDKRFYSPMTCLVDGTHIFVRDCVHFYHQQLGRTKAIVVKIFQEESLPDLLVEIEMLLTFEQYKLLVPNTECYIPAEVLVVMESTVVPLHSIYGLDDTPVHLIKWNSAFDNFTRWTAQETCDYLSPHPMKIKAAGKKVVMLPLILFSDDTSGNKSKKWHKFECWYLLLAGLPRHENAKTQNIHFVSCSDKMDVLDMAEPFAQELHQLETHGLIVYDAFLEEEVLVVAPLLCVICDNPRASQLLSHLGGSAKKYCRFCMADSSLPSLVLERRTREVCLEQIQLVRLERTESGKVAIRKLYGVKEVLNPFLEIPADLYECTPVEVLHTILLGPCKYFLKCVMPKLSKFHPEILARINAFHFSGFRVKMHGNVCWHHQSFVGRDYKAWCQMALFILHPYLTVQELDVLLKMTKVFYIAYCAFFDPTKAEEFQLICTEFVDSVMKNMPEMQYKLKIHLLLHLVECMHNFGPCSAFNAERCESFNSSVRLRNIFGNKRAPSRDIANYFARIQCIRYICQGGVFNGTEKCGSGLQKMYEHPDVQQFINSVSRSTLNANKEIYIAGTARKTSSCKPSTLSSLKFKIRGIEAATIDELCQLNPPFNVMYHDSQRSNEEFKEHNAVVSKTAQLVNSGDYIQLCTPVSQFQYCELISTVTRPNSDTLCIVRGFEELTLPNGEPLLNQFDCPLYKLSRTIFFVQSSNVHKAVSMVHECGEGCQFVEASTCRSIERIETIQVNRIFQHDWTQELYCRNLYCL